MIDELYDSVLSITNQSGYIDRVEQLDDDNKSLLRWSSNNLFKHNYKLPQLWLKRYNPPYPVIVFSYDSLIRAPFSNLISEEGQLINIY